MGSEIEQVTQAGDRLGRKRAIAPVIYVSIAMNLWVWALVAHVSGLNIQAHFYDQQRILQLLLLLGVVVAAVASQRTRKAILRGWDVLPVPARLGVAGFFGLGIASATQAAVPSAALREVGMFALLAVISLHTAAVRGQEGAAFDQTALRVIHAGAAVYVVVFAITDPVIDRGSSMLGFDNPTVFALIAVWFFPLLVGAALQGEGRPAVRFGRWLTVIGWWALVIEGGGRSGLYGSLLGVAVVGLVLGRASRGWLRAATGTLVAGTAVWWLWITLVGHGTGGLRRALDKGGDASGRLDMWANTLELAVSRPLLGVGPEHYAYHDTHLASPHNVPLQIAAEWGFPAALLLAALVAWGAIAWVRRRSRLRAADRSQATDQMSVQAALTAAITAAGFASLLEGMLSTPTSQVLLVVVVGWALGLHRQTPSTDRPRSTVAQVGLIACVLAAAAAVAIGALPEALRPSEQVDAYQEADPEARLSPRFWVQGRLDA